MSSTLNPQRSAGQGGNNEDFLACFTALRGILARFQPDLVLCADTPDQYYLDTAYRMKNGKPLFFGAVWIKKGYVSYHLFPIYMYPDLLKELSPGLKARMQGKSCFNFKRVEPEMFKELSRLTGAGFRRIKAEGFLPG